MRACDVTNVGLSCILRACPLSTLLNVQNVEEIQEFYPE